LGDETGINGTILKKALQKARAAWLTSPPPIAGKTKEEGKEVKQAEKTARKRGRGMVGLLKGKKINRAQKPGQASPPRARI